MYTFKMTDSRTFRAIRYKDVFGEILYLDGKEFPFDERMIFIFPFDQFRIEWPMCISIYEEYIGEIILPDGSALPGIERIEGGGLWSTNLRRILAALGVKTKYVGNSGSESSDLHLAPDEFSFELVNRYVHYVFKFEDLIDFDCTPYRNFSKSISEEIDLCFDELFKYEIIRYSVPNSIRKRALTDEQKLEAVVRYLYKYKKLTSNGRFRENKYFTDWQDWYRHYC